MIILLWILQNLMIGEKNRMSYSFLYKITNSEVEFVKDICL